MPVSLSHVPSSSQLSPSTSRQHQDCSQGNRVPVQQAPSIQPVLSSAAYQRSVQPTAVTIGSSQATPTPTLTSRLHCFCQHLPSTCVYHWLQGNGNGCTGQATVFNSLQVCDNSYLPTRATSSLVFPTSVELDCDYSYWAGPAKSLHHLLCLRCGVQGGVADRPASGDLDYSSVWCAGSYQCGTSGQVLWTHSGQWRP